MVSHLNSVQGRANSVPRPFLRRFAALAGVLAFAAGSASAQLQPDFTIIDNVHTDVAFPYIESVGWQPHIHTGTDTLYTNYSPDRALLYVNRATKIARPEGAAFDFLGTPAGSPVWILPQSQIAGQLWLGFEADKGLDRAGQQMLARNDTNWLRWDPDGAGGSSSSHWVEIALLATRGPGEFSLWTTGAFGGATVRMATVDGITDADEFHQLIRGHSHVNWGFTQPGRYELDLRARTFRADGTELASEVTTLYFEVLPDEGGSIPARFGAGSLLASQTRTPEADNVNELNQLFACVEEDVLRLALTGNLADDGSGIIVFLDTGEGGEVEFTSLGAEAGPRIGGLAGPRWDDDFQPDRALGLMMAAAMALCALAPVAAAPTRGYAVLVDEHVDIDANFIAGEWIWSANNGDAGVTHPPEAALLYAGPGADPDNFNPGLAGGRKQRPDGDEWDFIGLPAGQVYWQLLQSQDSSTLYLGFSAEDTPWNALDSYDAAGESGGRVQGEAPWIQLRLVRVEGPGHFSVWQSGSLRPVVFLSSADNGVDASDTLWILAGGHIHFNWAFTARGLYRVTLQASGRVGGQRVFSEEATFTFGVEVSGDMDGDRLVDLVDLVAMLRVAGGLSASPNPEHDVMHHADMDGDGTIGLKDAVILARLWEGL